MDDLVTRAAELLSRGESAAGLVALAIAAFFEYAFPPFPGDAVTLFGAFLAATARWRIASVFLAVTAGSLAGAALDYAVGRRLSARPDSGAPARDRSLRTRLAPVVARFERHGAILICLNRFFPGIRALFFVAAGYARLPLSRVLLFGAISAALWNGLLIGAGFAIGDNFGALRSLLERYTAAAWAILGILCAAALARAAWKRRRRR